MQRWKLKGCPRCGGDVFTTYDSNGGYEQCLQCAWQRELTFTGMPGDRGTVQKITTHTRGPYRIRRTPVKAGKD